MIFSGHDREVERSPKRSNRDNQDQRDRAYRQDGRDTFSRVHSAIYHEMKMTSNTGAEARFRALERLHGPITMTLFIVGVVATIGAARRRP